MSFVTRAGKINHSEEIFKNVLVIFILIKKKKNLKMNMICWNRTKKNNGATPV